MDIELLQTIPIFDGISPDDFPKLLECLKPDVRSFVRNEIIYSEGDTVSRLGVVIEGGVRIVETDTVGNVEVVGSLSSREIFGEGFVFGGGVSTVTLRAASPTEIMFISRDHISPCRSVCEFHERLVNNLFRLIAEKAEKLGENLRILQKRTIREKLLAYLRAQSKQAGAAKFKIPLNRAQLADYLCVDRSAMSRELCAMRDDGLLEFYKSSFILNDV